MALSNKLFKQISSSLNRKKLDEQFADTQLSKATKGKVLADKIEIGRIISNRLTDIRTGQTEISDKEYHHTGMQGRNKYASHIRSTAINSVRYDPNNNHLYVQYTSGPKWYVFDADEDTFQQFMRSGSKGRFVQYNLKPNNRAPRSWY